jgi:hypothetical protein
MDFNLRKMNHYAFCSMDIDNTTVDLGCLDNGEAKSLLNDFKRAVEDLEWFVKSTEENEE